MKTILIADDEKDILELMRYNLHKEGYNILLARNGQEALDQAKVIPDLILLDIMMPVFDGREVLKRLQRDARTAAIPVVFLTARGDEMDEVLGLELGASDYLVKPVSIPKLMARVKNILRKHEDGGPEVKPDADIIIGPISIFPGQYRVHVDGVEVFFPRKEFEVLRYLASHPGQVVRRDALLAAVWGADVYVVDRTVDVHIRKIREKLGPHAFMIDTIKGVGYRFNDRG